MHILPRSQEGTTLRGIACQAAFHATRKTELIRSGIEDFDLFTMAEQVIGREAVTERILSAVPSLVEVAADGDTFLRIRKSIGDVLEQD